MTETYRLRSVTVEIDPRGDYLHTALRGSLATTDDMRQVVSLLGHVMGKLAIRRFLVSGRELDGQPPKEAWSTLWSWLGERTCRQLAWVVPPGTRELTMTTLNMAAMTDSLAFRAFPMVLDAARWLELRSTASNPGRRQSSTDLSNVRESGELERPSRRLGSAEPATEDERARDSVTEIDVKESGQILRPSLRVDQRAEPETPRNAEDSEQERQRRSTRR